MDILIVDDDADMVEGMTQLLQLRGYRIKSANSIHTARRLLNSTHFEVVLLDFMLPDGCGIELLDERAFDRAVMITGHPGINAFIKHMIGPRLAKLEKPTTIEQIIAAIEQTDEPNEATIDAMCHGKTIRQIEKEMIIGALKHQPNKRAAAKALGISLNTLYNRIATYKIPLGRTHE